MKRWITTKEAADLVGVCADTVKNLCREGQLPAEKPGRDWLVDSESTEFLLWRQAANEREKDRESA